MNEEYNSFMDCTLQRNEDSGACWISSRYWSIDVPNEAAGMQIMEFIKTAYMAGIAYNQKKIKQALGISNE